MEPNEILIRRFYSAFQQKDYSTMISCYREDALFSDPVFGLLQGGEIAAMWEMLCRRAESFSLEYSDIELLDEEYATCHWTAHYIFSITGRQVNNRVKAHLRIQDGLISEHTDQFNIWAWSRQALGWSGRLLGWTHFMKNRIHRNARESLDRFISGKSRQ